MRFIPESKDMETCVNIGTLIMIPAADTNPTPTCNGRWNLCPRETEHSINTLQVGGTTTAA
jgi:hypothetical protein